MNNSDICIRHQTDVSDPKPERPAACQARARLKRPSPTLRYVQAVVDDKKMISSSSVNISFCGHQMVI